jgi:hypothetical protein
MAERVVDLLEAVEIDMQDRELLPCRPCGRPASAASRAMSSLRRLASPVSGSCSELCSMRFLASSSSMFLAIASSLAALQLRRHQRVFGDVEGDADDFQLPLGVSWTLPSERT